MQHSEGVDRSGGRMSPWWLAAAAMGLMGHGAQAFEIDTGDGDLKLRWDNTVKYSTAARVEGSSDGLTRGPNGANSDDGDRNFEKGLISNRFDLLSELDAQYGGFGARVSAAAWYDSVYQRRNDNPGFGGGAFPNQTSVPYDQFTRATRKVHGRNAEWLDAFVFGRTELSGVRTSFRLGQHSVLWGESLFFGANAIAGGQSPVDVVKLVSVPGTPFKEAVRPVPQLSATLQATPSVSIGAYYQFHWAPSRVPAVGSYFAWSDNGGDGAEQILLPQAPNGPFLDGNAPRIADQRPSNRGQGGLQLRFRGEGTDYGLYLIRFHQKTFQVVPTLGVRSALYVPGPGCVVPGSFPTGSGGCGLVAPVNYRLAYHQGITALGASASHTFGDVNLAVEGSLRHNMDLASTQGADAAALGGPAADNAGHPAYAVGKTAHLNLSALWQLPVTPLFREATLAGEVAWNRVLSITKNAQAVDPNATRDAWALRFVVEPTYRQVISGLDLGVPLGLGWAPRNSRSMALGPAAMPPAGGGDLSLGLNGGYLDVWRFSLAFTHYFGPEGTWIENGAFSYKQTLKDRDFVAFSVRRTF
jgi:hypothetical protein